MTNTTDDIFVTFELDPVFLSLKELVSQNFIAASTNQNLNCYILHTVNRPFTVEDEAVFSHTAREVEGFT